MDFVWLILTLIKATTMIDLQLHLASIYSLCPIIFAYYHINYARYLPFYLMTIMNLSITHPGAEKLLRDNSISVHRSSVALSRNAVDITKEQTIIRHAKSQGGIIGFSRYYAAYCRWCVTRHYRTKLVEATLFLADIFPFELSVHSEFQPAHIKSKVNSYKPNQRFNSKPHKPNWASKIKRRTFLPSIWQTSTARCPKRLTGGTRKRTNCNG